MLSKTRKRLERLEVITGITDSSYGFTLDRRIRELEDRIRLLSQHLGVEFTYIPERKIVRKVEQ